MRNLIITTFSLLLAGFSTALGANKAASSPDFDADGKADFLFQNKTDGTCHVWFMNGNSFRYSAPISLVSADKSWKIVGAGYFDASNTNRLAILWQHEINQALALWYLSGTNNTTYDTAVVLNDVPGSGWKAVGVGDFNGDGKSDIAFHSESTGGYKAVWLMSGVTPINPMIIDTASGSSYKITGTGDFGSSSNPTNGVPDGKSDIILEQYNPATDTISTDICALWFMDGTTIAAGYVLYDPIGAQNALVGDPDYRAVATGSMNSGTDSKTDLVFRHSTIGRNLAWFMSGYLYLTNITYLRPEPDPAFKLYSQDWQQSTWRQNDLYPSITATPSTSEVILNFRIKTNSTYGVTIRRRIDRDIAWTNLITNWTSSAYTNSFTLTNGVRYEYEVAREGSPPADNYPARILTGIGLTATNMESRGKVIVIVDGQVATNITSSLNTYTNDLIGDGWTVVIKTDATRHDDSSESCSTNARTTLDADDFNRASQTNLKQWIRTNHSDAKGIVLIGHVTIPYSGVFSAFPPDGHTNHPGAWVADMWYGDLGSDSAWIDGTGWWSCLKFPQNTNLAGDGKFENDFAPSGLTMFVGRIDFARLPSFGTSNQVTQAESDLLARYFTKDHTYRTKAIQLESRGIVFSAFDITQYQADRHNAVYERAFRNLSPHYGLGFDKIVIGDPYHQKTDSYLWGFLSGTTGRPDRISEGQPGGSSDPSDASFLEHTTASLTMGESKIAFYLLFGSYFGDWNFSDDFMRATLATTNYGLASVWMSLNPFTAPGYSGYSGSTHWQFHPSAVGDVIGTGLIQTLNNGRASSPDVLALLSILGDPTLRTTVLAPVQIVNPSRNINLVSLSWTPGESGCMYYVYEAPSKGGSYSRVSGTWPTSSTSVSFTAQASSTVFMVRATKNVITGSATYENLSQGAFWP